MTVRLYGGIHHVSDNIAGKAIILGTEAALKGNWVLGGERPATHAFVVLSEGDLHWRLDGKGKPSRAAWSPCAAPVELVAGPVPMALWEIHAPQDALMRGAVKAREMAGAAYDWSEIAAAVAVAFSVLPGLQRLRFLGTKDAFREAAICTQVLRLTLLAVFAPPGPFALVDIAGMPDLYPERIGQIMRAGEGLWTSRVLGVHG